MAKEYRIGHMYYDGRSNYHIERRIDDGKWKLLFGGLDYNTAQEFIKNPDAIESYYNSLNRAGYVIVCFIILMITLLCFSDIKI